MMKNKNKILDLASVYSSFNIGETINLLDKFKSGRDEILQVLNDVKGIQDYSFEKNVLISKLEDELLITNLNIETLENAIMCHETKFIEVRTTKSIGAIKLHLN